MSIASGQLCDAVVLAAKAKATIAHVFQDHCIGLFMQGQPGGTDAALAKI